MPNYINLKLEAVYSYFNSIKFLKINKNNAKYWGSINAR